MPEMTLKIKTNDYEKDVGEILWTLGPGEVSFDIPLNQNIDEETHVMLSGLQYYDFSMFVVLLEVTNPGYGSRFFLVDSEKIDREDGGVHYLPEISGGYKEFNKIAADYINGNHMKPITVYDEVDTKVLNMSEQKEYAVKVDMTETYERISFVKKDSRIFVAISGGEFLEPYKWEFDLNVIDLLIDDNVQIDGFDDSLKRALLENPVETATIEDLVVIEHILNYFFLKFEQLPKALRFFVRLPQ